MREEQMKIAQIEAQAQAMQQRARQFIDSDEDSQASMVSEMQRAAQAMQNAPEEQFTDEDFDEEAYADIEE